MAYWMNSDFLLYFKRFWVERRNTASEILFNHQGGQNDYEPEQSVFARSRSLDFLHGFRIASCCDIPPEAKIPPVVHSLRFSSQLTLENHVTSAAAPHPYQIVLSGCQVEAIVHRLYSLAELNGFLIRSVRFKCGGREGIVHHM